MPTRHSICATKSSCIEPSGQHWSTSMRLRLEMGSPPGLCPGLSFSPITSIGVSPTPSVIASACVTVYSTAIHEVCPAATTAIKTKPPPSSQQAMAPNAMPVSKTIQKKPATKVQRKPATTDQPTPTTGCAAQCQGCGARCGRRKGGHGHHSLGTQHILLRRPNRTAGIFQDIIRPETPAGSKTGSSGACIAINRICTSALEVIQLHQSCTHQVLQ